VRFCDVIWIDRDELAPLSPTEDANGALVIPVDQTGQPSDRTLQILAESMAFIMLSRTSIYHKCGSKTEPRRISEWSFGQGSDMAQLQVVHFAIAK
jgi:hypothetical protein